MRSVPPSVSLARPYTGIVDVHHDDGPFDLDEVKRGGVCAIIHKCTQGEKFKANVRGSGWRDPNYASVMPRLKRAGMLRGAYAFLTGTANGADQAEHFVSSLGDDSDDILLMLDWESNPNTKIGDMSVDNLVQCAARVKELTGRWPFVYSFTHYFKSHYRVAHPVLARCPLMLSQFGERPQYVPPGWDRYDLWQFTNGSAGPLDQRAYPRTSRGFQGRDGRQDRSAFFGGGEAELREAWMKWGRWE